MTVERLRRFSEPLMEPLVAASVRLGLGPHAVSVIAFGCAVVAGAAFALGGTLRWWYLVGAAFVALNGLLDVLDGALARELEIASPAGDVLDHTLDRYADIVLVAGLAAGVGQYLLGFLAVTGVLMTSYLGTQAQAVEFGRLYAGVMGRSDRLVLIALAGVVIAATPAAPLGLTAVGWLLVVFAVVGHLTAVQRFVSLWRGLR